MSVLLTILASFPRTTASLFLMTTGKLVYATEGKTLKVALCTKVCPLCDKPVIAGALGQLRINFTRIFKVFQIEKL